MENELLRNIFQSTNVHVDLGELLLSLVVGLALGFLLAAVYKYKTLYSKEFVLTLSLLPALIAMIIFLVNGNLGTSVAVAGTFSLIRFRSAAGSAKELLCVFIATAIGLATGMGFLYLAIAFTLLISIVLILLENSSFITTSQTRRHLLVTVPEDYNYDVTMESIFVHAAKYVELVSIKSKKGNLILEYNLDLDSHISDNEIIHRLREYEDIIEINISKLAQKKKTL